MRWSTHRLVNTCLIAWWPAGPSPGCCCRPSYRSSPTWPALLAGSLPLLYVMRKRTARMRRFEELFPDSLEFVARSMRAGHAFSVSLEMIHREFQEPLSGEFRRTFEEHNLGLPLDVALAKAGQARALAGRALLRFGRAAAEAYRRQPGRDSGQAGVRHPRTFQAAREKSGPSARTDA